MDKIKYPLYETTYFEDIREMIENAADRFPDRTAIAYRIKPQDPEPMEITYTEALKRMTALGTGLIARKFQNKTVALIGDASYDWICVYLTAMIIGSLIVPIDKDLPAEEMADIIHKAGCSAVFCSTPVSRKLKEIDESCLADLLEIGMTDTKQADELTVERICEEGLQLLTTGDTRFNDIPIDTEKPALLVFTSGTTGSGKGVLLSQKNIVSDMVNGMYLFSITNRTINFLPPHHTFGSTVVFVGHYAQGCTIYLSSGLRYIAKEIQEQKPSHLVLVPLFLEKLHDRIWSTAAEKDQDSLLRAMIHVSNGLRKCGIDLRRVLFKRVLKQLGGQLELVISGGAALRQDVIDTFDSIGVTILNGYGITECAPLVSCNRNRFQKPGSVGIPILHETVKILEPDENGEGEICVKGPNVMLGYFQNPEATAAAFDSEGYFKTGDIGRLDQDGWLYITGRKKNIIVFSNGKNIYPEEIEERIASIPGVSEVVVYAGQSYQRANNQTLVAEIFPDADKMATLQIEDVKLYFEAEIKKVNQKMVAYKAIGQIKIREEDFDKNTSRKIKRYAIDKTID